MDSNNDTLLPTVREIMDFTSPEKLDLSQWPNTPHPGLLCDCDPPVPFKRRSGARGPFWGCANYKSADFKGCGTLNDTKAISQLKLLRAKVCEVYGIEDDVGCDSDDTTTETKKVEEKKIDKFVKPPVFRALFSPVDMRMRTLVGATPINHAPNFIPSQEPQCKTTIKSPDERKEMMDVAIGGSNTIVTSSSSAEKPDTEVTTSMVEGFNMDDLDAPLTRQMIKAYSSATASGKVLTTKTKEQVLPTADNTTKRSKYHQDALDYLCYGFYETKGIGVPEVLSYGCSRRNEDNYDQIVQHWRDVAETTTTTTATTKPNSPIWITAMNEFARVSLGVDYILNINDRAITFCVIEPWISNKTSDEMMEPLELPTTMVALEWHGSARKDLGKIKTSTAELLLLPTGYTAIEDADNIVLQWTFVNLAKLRRVLFQQEDVINNMEVFNPQQTSSLTAKDYKAIAEKKVDLVALLNSIIPEKMTKATMASTNSKKRNAEGQVKTNEEDNENPTHKYHDTHPNELLCGDKCRKKPTYEETQEQAISGLVERIQPYLEHHNPAELEYPTGHVAKHFLMVSASSEAFYVSQPCDRYLVSSLEQLDAFLKHHNLYDESF
jgi:hypothetical protein